MKYQVTSIVFLAVTTVIMFASCSKMESKPAQTSALSDQLSLQDKMSENGTNPDEAVLFKTDGSAALNHFYIESNRHSINTVFVFTQKQNGQVTLDDEVVSGGYGYGQGLGSQGAIAVSKESGLLFAVNPGSGSISSFRINAATGGLQLLFTAYSAGLLPTSLSVFGNKLFVLNNLSSLVTGFTFTANGFLSPIKGSTHNLSSLSADGAEIKFQPDGAALYVTEKATNLIDKFTLDNTGAITSMTTIQSAGVEPFGFDYARNGRYMVVSNAANGSSGSCTSYKYSSTKGLVSVNGAVSDFETAACWVATTMYGSFAFVSNTASNNISSYYIDQSGVLTLIHPVAAQDGEKPIDIAVSADNKYVYAIYSGSHIVAVYRRKSSGVIELADKITTLPAYASGLAVY